MLGRLRGRVRRGRRAGRVCSTWRTTSRPRGDARTDDAGNVAAAARAISRSWKWSGSWRWRSCFSGARTRCVAAAGDAAPAYSRRGRRGAHWLWYFAGRRCSNCRVRIRRAYLDSRAPLPSRARASYALGAARRRWAVIDGRAGHAMSVRDGGRCPPWFATSARVVRRPRHGEGASGIDFATGHGCVVAAPTADFAFGIHKLADAGSSRCRFPAPCRAVRCALYLARIRHRSSLDDGCAFRP